MAEAVNLCRRFILIGARKRRLLLLILIFYAIVTYFLRYHLWNVLEQVRYRTISVKTPVQPESKRELVLLQVLFRHGHHSPFSSYPLDHIPDSYWIEGMGQLTQLGRLQHYAVGKYLRQRYDGFLSYNVQEVHCTSSIAFRSLYGGYAFLAGFYPAPPGKKIAEDLSWQPVACFFESIAKDKYLQSLPNCAAAEVDKSTMFRTKEAAIFMRPYKHMYKFWAENSGLDVQTYGDAGSLFKTLLAEKTQNLTIPKWAEDTWEALEVNANICYHFNFRTRLLHRLRAGPVIGLMVERMKNKVENPNDKRKVYVYSGHGSNVAAVLQALRVFNNRIPTYGSTILFELYREVGGNHSLRILLTNDTAPEIHIGEPHVLKLPGCSEYCSLDDVERSTSDLYPLEWEKECMEADESRIFNLLGLSGV